MTGRVAHIVKPVGFLCLAGQGFLLFQRGGNTLVEGISHPEIFLLLTVLLALVSSLPLGAYAIKRRGSAVWSMLLLLSLATMVAVSLKSLNMAPAHESNDQRNDLVHLDEQRIGAKLSWQELDKSIAKIFASAVSEIPASADSLFGGDTFRLMGHLSSDWPVLLAETGGLTVEGVFWQDGQRSAWTGGAESLPLEWDNQNGDVLLQGRQQWFRQLTRSVGPSLVLELQIPLTTGRMLENCPDLKSRIFPLSQIPMRINKSENSVGRPEHDALFVDSINGLGLVLVGNKWTKTNDGGRQTRARLMLMLGLTWFIALMAVSRQWLGMTGFIVAFWCGRTAMALVGFFRWGTWAFPQQELPAAPDRLISLLDPAYFATPFAFGFFASTADALLTSLLVAISVWAVLNWVGLVGTHSTNYLPPKFLVRHSQGVLSGLFFGVTGTVLLWGSRFFASLMATNANPRLIGESVPLKFLSFWFLHLVLMLLVFSIFSLLVGLWAGRAWPDRSRLLSWLTGGFLAFTGSLVLAFVVTDWWWGGCFLLSLTILGLWVVTPFLGARPRFLRRFTWPMVLILVSIWNYSSLSNVYEQAENNWLKAKADQLAEPTNVSAPYLLDEALREMRLQDSQSDVAPVDSHDVWRDEPAYLLWRNSSLRDLGLPMQVEIIDEYDNEESLFTTGFMGDYNYQVGDRTRVLGNQDQESEGEVGRIFEEIQRLYPDGEELILAGEMSRKGDRGWIRVEFPVRSWRIETQLAGLTKQAKSSMGGYRPRSEVDRPVLLLRGDSQGWLDVGQRGIPAPEERAVLAQLKSGKLSMTEILVGDTLFLCLWKALPESLAHFPGEGYLLGVEQSTLRGKLLDLSRLMLLNLVFLALLVLVLHLLRWVKNILSGADASQLVTGWSTGFQERFLAGYLFFGLLLLLVVGTSVDRVGQERIRAESRVRTRVGLDSAVQQLRSLLAEQAYTLSSSDYINDMLLERLNGEKSTGSRQRRQAMVFDENDNLILDETSSNLTASEARLLLAVGRTSPMVVMEDNDLIFVATVVPIDLSEVLAISDNTVLRDGRIKKGFFLYRQVLDHNLLTSLAELVQGQATLSLGGRPVLASHPEGVFSGREPLLADPEMMGTLLDHAQAAVVFASEGRPFAFMGAQSLPAFSRLNNGRFGIQATPSVLALVFPDREKQFVDQRRATVLFLAGMANLILLTALLLAMLMSWNLFRPLRVLLTATQSMARGDFNAPLPEAGRDEVGRLTSAFGRMRSELATAREELLTREKFLTSVLDRVTVGVAVIDENLNLVSLNPAGQNILMDFEPTVDEHQGVLRLLSRFRKLAAGADQWGGEMSSADGLRTLRGAMAPLDLPDDRIDTMLVFEDITEFLQTRKMAINAELARQVAHEIKNPLTPIQLSVQLLQQAWQDKHPRLDHIVPDTVKRVLSQVDLLRSIAAEFSLLGRPGDLEREALDFVNLVSNTVDRYGAEESDSTVTVNMEEADLPQVLANQDSLQKILGNLMQNSLDAVIEGEKSVLDLRWRVADESVTLLWADNGMGLDPEVADRLFDPYFSTKSKGTGLGLAICRNLADRMGGTIILRNRPEGSGALAELTLPRVYARSIEGSES